VPKEYVILAICKVNQELQPACLVLPAYWGNICQQSSFIFGSHKYYYRSHTLIKALRKRDWAKGTWFRFPFMHKESKEACYVAIAVS
jgi:hypothetical protein